MENINIPLEGKEISITLKQIETDKLVLDELNPRISFFRDNQLKEHLTENEIIFALTNKNPEAFNKLKASIEINEGIINPIWVELRKGNPFLIIEGNTRILIYQQLHEKYPNKEVYKKILCYVLPEGISDNQRNFIKLEAHLRGITPWDAYEKAKYLFKLWDEDGYSYNRLEKLTKMRKKEIENNIKAYQIMEQQYLPKYGNDPNEVSKFSYFVEYVKDGKLQKIMKKIGKNIQDYCDWVSDKNKIPTGQDVRKLRYILEIAESKDSFLNCGFESAIETLNLKKPNLVSSLYRDIENVTEGLKSISSYEIDEMINEESSERENMIREMVKWGHKILDLINREKDGIT